jgi:hypothetical protein
MANKRKAWDILTAGILRWRRGGQIGDEGD